MSPKRWSGDSGPGRPPGRTLSPLCSQRTRGPAVDSSCGSLAPLPLPSTPRVPSTGLSCSLHPVHPSAAFWRRKQHSEGGGHRAHPGGGAHLKSRPSAPQAQPRGTRMVPRVRMENAALPLNLSQLGGILGRRSPLEEARCRSRGGKAHGRLFPVTVLIMRVRVNTDGGSCETGLRLNTGLTVAAATTNRTTCSLRYSLPCLFGLFWTPFQDTRRLDPASFSLLPGADITVPGFFPREIR